MFIVSILIPFSIASLTFTLYYNYIIKKQNAQNISSIMTSVNQNIDTRLAELKNISTTGYMNSSILESMKSLNHPEANGYYDSLELNRLENDYTIAMTKLLFTSQQSIYNISFFPVNDLNSFYSLGKSSAGIKRLPFKDYRNQEWFTLAEQGDGDLIFYPAHVPYYLGTDHTPPVFSAVRLILDMDSKKHIGILKIDSRLSNLEQLMDSLTIGAGNHIMIVDSSGTVVAGTGDGISSFPSSFLNDTEASISIGEERYALFTSPVKKTDWNLVYLSNLNSETQRFLLSALISIACMTVGTLVAFAIYRSRSVHLVNSVGSITNTIHQFEHGNLKARAVVNTNTELKIIADELNQMADNLDLYIKREYIAVINQQKAEYKALQSQINPHFLYNTLNGFIALNRMGEKKILEKSIIQLTHMFQYTCHPEDTTSLEHELHFLEEYLNLQKLKYDDRLEFEIHFDPACHRLKIPKLLLQPIVENSILHGLEPTARTIRITIICQAVVLQGIGSAILILLTDNGVGCRPEDMLSAKERVGFMNVRDRTVLFHPGAVCHVESSPGFGTRTIFLFPTETEEESKERGKTLL